MARKLIGSNVLEFHTAHWFGRQRALVRIGQITEEIAYLESLIAANAPSLTHSASHPSSRPRLVASSDKTGKRHRAP